MHLSLHGSCHAAGQVLVHARPCSATSALPSKPAASSKPLPNGGGRSVEKGSTAGARVSSSGSTHSRAKPNTKPPGLPRIKPERDSNESSSSPSSTASARGKSQQRQQQQQRGRQQQQHWQQHQQQESTPPGTYLRVFQVAVPYVTDPGKDDFSVSEVLRKAVVKRLGCKDSLPATAIHLVRKSFDSRPKVKGIRAEKKWVYVVDVDAAAIKAAGGHKVKEERGQLELVHADHVYSHDTMLAAQNGAGSSALREATHSRQQYSVTGSVGGAGQAADLVMPAVKSAHPVVVIGSGPAGLFAALTAAQAGLPVLVLERGQPVEQRGKDIGALLVRGLLNPESNLCYGEGGAGTWSDGKLATKIGRNSDPVRAVLGALVDFGAPESILVAGKPHLGTDRLVRILRGMRTYLMERLGAQIRFGTLVEDLEVSHGRVTGVRLAGTREVIKASAVVLAVGHSARGMYRRLRAHDVLVTPKPFAMGFRVEHPQSLIDQARYGADDATHVQRGKGRMPVADYKLNCEVQDDTFVPPAQHGLRHSTGLQDMVDDMSMFRERQVKGQIGNAVQTQSGATVSEGLAKGAATENSAGAGAEAAKRKAGRAGEAVEEYGGGSGRAVPPGMRGVFSFCMCPGGQIVCTSTRPEELCLNGMSFSRRNSQWANSALVVNISPQDWTHHVAQHGPLAGMALQEDIEREAARRGGGNNVAPVQRVVDFLAGDLSDPHQLPSSSYRLGVCSASLHDIYPAFVSKALAKALASFERTIPGFMTSPDALLHGVETRTSAPVRVDRDPDTLECLSMKGLYPSGEGAGYAGGIVSAAVDGMKVGQAIVQQFVTASPAE